MRSACVGCHEREHDFGRRRMNILIVDDDASLLRSLEIVLTVRGHRVMAFRDPAAAMRYLEGGPDIHVLLLDYMLDGMHGDEWLESAGARISTGCTTIMITGHKEQVQSSRSLQRMGVRRILGKPLDLERLCTWIENEP